MKTYELTGQDLSLVLEPNVFVDEVHLPTNTLMKVRVESAGFCGSAVFDVDAKELGRMALALDAMYETLKGETEIREPYGFEQFLRFVGNGRGQIWVTGFLCGGFHGLDTQQLRFENVTDQTCLYSFARELREDFAKYAK